MQTTKPTLTPLHQHLSTVPSGTSLLYRRIVSVHGFSVSHAWRLEVVVGSCHGPPIHHTMCQQCWYAPTSRVYGGYATSRRWAANYSAVLHACIGLPFPYRATVCFSKKEAGFYDHYNSFQVSHSAREKSETSRTLAAYSFALTVTISKKGLCRVQRGRVSGFFFCAVDVCRDALQKRTRIKNSFWCPYHTQTRVVFGGVAN